jgi:hypothetical protein
VSLSIIYSIILDLGLSENIEHFLNYDMIFSGGTFMRDDEKKPSLDFNQIKEVKVKMDLYHPGSHQERVEKENKKYRVRKRHHSK